MMDRFDAEKEIAALEHMRRARMNFEERICEASTTQDEAILEGLRLEAYQGPDSQGNVHRRYATSARKLLA